MKKCCRLFIFSLIAMVASLFLTSNVFAYYVDQIVGTYKSDTSSSATYNKKVVYNPNRIRWSEGEKRWYDSQSKYSNNKTNYTWYTTSTYYVTHDGTKQQIFCIDKHSHSGNQNAGMKVIRVLDPTDPKDAVILKILSTSGYNYFEKVIAIRAFVGFMPDFGIVANEAACANHNSGISWAADSDIREATAKVLGFSKASDVTTASLTKINGVNNHRTGNASKTAKKQKYYCRANLALSMCSKSKCNANKRSKQLYKLAIKYGADVADGKIPEPKKVTNSSFDVTKGTYQTIYEDGNRMAVREIAGNITFKHFNDESTEPVNIVVTPDTNKYASGIKYEYQIAGTDTWTEFNETTDFKPLLKSDKVVINVKVTIKVPTIKTKVAINFNIAVKYTDKDVVDGALLGNSKNPFPNTQRYYIWESNPNKTHSIPAKINIPIIACDDNVPNKNDVTSYKDYVNTCCRGNNEEQFSIIEECNVQLSKASTEEEKENIRKTNKYCILKAEYCDPCNTQIEVPKTCSDFADGDFEKGQTASIKGPDDIKVCVMDGEDEAKHSYKLTKPVSVNGNDGYTFNDNKYCKVSCKEDYSFDLPTGRYVISGRYFELQMGVSATKTCYTDIIDYQAFEKDLAEYGNKLNSYISSGSATVLNKEFVKTYADYKKAITDIEACSLGWDNSYKQNPEITFDYEEEYIEKLLGGSNLNFVASSDKTTTETKWFCNGSDVDRKYNECIGAKATSEAQTKTITVKECTTTNATTYSCKDVQKQVPTTKFAKVATTFKSTYAPESIFYTKYSTGVIEVDKTGKLSGNGKYTKLDKYLDSKIDETAKVKNGTLPVALKDGKGVYNYNIMFANVGEYFDKEGFGRLLGGKNSATLANDNTTFKGTYVCSYVVNCPECKVACKEDPTKGIFCTLESKDEPECVGTCAYDKGYGELYSIQQISITNFNPTERTLGANLNTEKGQALIQSITDKGESIYNEPEYSFTFTPAAISF